MFDFTPITKIEERIVFNATQKKVPLGGSFELTPLCNMNCKMCFLRLSKDELCASRYQLKSVKEWMLLAGEARNAGLLFLLLTGGEPFIYPGFEDLYKGLSSMGFILTINTNGTLITEKYADMLAKYRPRRVNITLYGSNNTVYGRLCNNPKGFTQFMNSIQLLKERNVPLKLNSSVTKDNVDDLDNILRIANDLQIPIQVDSYMFPCSRKETVKFDDTSRLSPEEAAEAYIKIKRSELSAESFKTLIKTMNDCFLNQKFKHNYSEVEQLPCRAGRSSFWIAWNGMMTPCVFMDKPKIDVFDMGFNHAWRYITEQRENLHLPVECTNCARRSVCDVCGASVYTETGAYNNKPEYMCNFMQSKLSIMHRIYETEMK